MRTKDFLYGINEIPTLLQWLYLSEKNTVTVENAIGVKLELSMTDEGRILSRNLNFPELEPHGFDSELNTDSLLSIIEQLKENPAEQFQEQYASRWEEIKSLTAMQMTVNQRTEREGVL